MRRIAVTGLSVLLAAGITFIISACGGGSASSTNGSGNSALNMTGTWTIKAVSTQGYGNFSGTATVTQSGQGLGVNGTTALTAAVGKITLSQTGTALTGTITNSLQAVTYSFIGTLSNGDFTITGSAPCSESGSQSTSIAGTIASDAAQGTYTISRSSKCYYSSDAGTFVATKK